MADMTVEAVPEVNLGQTIKTPSVPPTFSGNWSDFQKDMAAIAVEQQPAQPEIQPQAVVTEAPKTIEPVAATPQEPAKIEVPDKFKAPDGSIDQERILKSYLEAEKTLKRLQNQAQAAPVPQAPAPIQPPQAPAANAAQLDPFTLQVAQELINESAAYGYQMPQGQAIAQARVQIKLAEAKLEAEKAATFSKLTQFEQRLEEQSRQDELASLAKNAPWILTPDSQKELIKIREENPEINSSRTPWRNAAIFLLGQKALMGAPQVSPTPKAQQNAPALPVVAAQSPQPTIKIDTPDQLFAHLATLPKAEAEAFEAKFWQSQGLRWDVPKQYKGL